jgi:ATP-dependent RNA helicase SUPV3L1/SUV3
MNIPIPNLPRPSRDRAAGVTVVLGPTNTGKTHYAIERMLGHSSGMIGLPLRLLAREVYNRVVERAGVESVALVTGEEKIKPKAPRYWVATVEAMPRDLDLAFVAVDEIQLAADIDRGHVFTDRILNRRGREETLLIGAATMQRAVEALLPGVHVMSRPRLSTLSFAGEKKISRLPRRSAVVAFSAEEVYAIAELIRRQRGGAAVVMGALSPRTRNAQVDMFQQGDVDYIVATDAIGMGLNLDVDHIAFAGDRKFDGWHYRPLNPAEFGQIAGRAGRYLRDGTFGTTGRCAPFDADLVSAIEEHRFDPIRLLQWRNSDLDFSSIAALAGSLEITPNEPGLARAPIAEDQLVLDIAARDPNVQRATKTRADVARLWDCCQIPDYRKLSPSAHTELVLSIFGYIVRAAHIPDDWFAAQIAALDRIDGDIDALSARIAQVRTWTYIANRPDWLRDPEHWQGVARRVEDSLSDALHERLAQRFVDRRTSVLMRRLRENAMLEAEVTIGGDVMVEGQHVGHLNGFRFTPDPQAAGEAARALNAAAQKALASEIEGRATRVHEAVDTAFVLANDGIIRWLGEPVGTIGAGAHVLEPVVRVLSDEHLSGPALEMVQRRLDLWLGQHVTKLLGPLKTLEAGEGLDGMARGIAFQIGEALGVLDRTRVANEVKTLPQEARAALRQLGIRFGAYHLYLPALLKPAPRALAAQLWALRSGETKGLDDVPHRAASGRTSFPADPEVSKSLYRAAGFRVCGDRAVRVDILERLADLIRPAIAYRPGTTPGDPPPGAADGNGFVVTVAMTSLAGCAGESFASILKSLGYVVDRRKGPPITVPLLAKAATEPLPAPATGAADADDPIQADGDSVAASDADEAAPTESSGEASDLPLAAAEAEVVAVEHDTEAGPDEAVATEVVAEGVDASAAVEASLIEPPLAEPSTPPLDASAYDAASSDAVSGEPESEDPTIASAEPPLEAASADATPSEAAEEPVLIEVWRPHRQHHHNQSRRPAPRGERRRPPAAANGHAAPQPGAPSDGTPGREEGPARPRHPQHRRPDEPGGRPRPVRHGEAAGAPRGKPRFDKPRFDKPRREGREGGPNGRPRGPERSGDRTFASTETPRGRDRAPDPNSPFAALLALKEQMDKDRSK